jgi:hypothetical protein
MSNSFREFSIEIINSGLLFVISTDDANLIYCIPLTPENFN